jgi:hypothetical protein
LNSLTTEAVIRSSQARPNNTLRMTASKSRQAHQSNVKMSSRRFTRSLSTTVVAVFLLSFTITVTGQDTQPATPAEAAKVLGTIQSISGNTIALKKDDGGDASVSVQAATRLARVAPGQKDLKNATTIRLRDLQVGDRILVRGKASVDGNSILATAVLAMKKSDVEAKQQSEREDWQRRGVAGVVTSVDENAGTVAISIPSLRDKKTVIIRTTKNTIVRRYAPDSVKFDDAKIGTLAQIRPGDQLRARGNRSAEDSELVADEIVSGSFRNIAGTITSTDVGANTLSVLDLSTKKPIVVKLTSESQVRKLPPEMAQRIAMRLKEPSGSSRPQAGANGAGDEASGQNGGARAGGGFRTGGQPDFQQLLSRMPPATVTDFQKGDAVMIVSTEGSGTGAVTAITLLGGVEPILAASSNGSEPMRLSPWTLGMGGGEEAAQ